MFRVAAELGTPSQDTARHSTQHTNSTCLNHKTADKGLIVISDLGCEGNRWFGASSLLIPQEKEIQVLLDIRSTNK